MRLLLLVFLGIALVLPVYSTPLPNGDEIYQYEVFTDTTLFNKNEAPRDYIRFYQKYIGAVRGFTCPMYPTCSFYGTDVFKQYSVGKAFVLTSDRLMRCGHEPDYYPLTFAGNKFQFLDTERGDSVEHALKIKRNYPVFAFNDFPNSTLPDSLFKFVRYLINNNYYEQALLEIFRLEHQGYSDPALNYNKLLCHYALGNYEEVIFEVETANLSDLAYEARMLAAKSAYQLRNFGMSKQQGEQALALGNTEEKQSAAKLLILSQVEVGNWENARSLAGKYFEADNKINTILESQRHLRYKSPAAATFLGIVPGLGYFYSGHKQTALSAFVLNGLLGYATYTSIKKENYGMAALTGIFATSFYIGNIYGSGKSARRFNKNLEQNLLKSLTITHPIINL